MTVVALSVAITLAALSLAAMYMIESFNAMAGHQDDMVIVPSVATDIAAFKRAFAAAAGQAALDGNRVTIYQNGNEIFPAMLAAIDGAARTLHFATFIYWAGVIPEQFGDAFQRAARRGVEVKMLLDSNGSKKIPRALVARLREAGCDVRRFRKAEWADWTKYNRRMHTKILIADGRVGFTGGVGIADEWSGAGDSPGHWRDTYARFDGPAVNALHGAFIANWNESTGELLLRDDYFPEAAAAGDIPVCIVQSNPGNGTSPAQRAMAALIGGAMRSLWITNAYFVPSAPFVRALSTARRRGVDVKILLPGPFHNKPTVRRASRRTWRRLLDAGVELYEHRLTMVHAKVVIVDGAVTMIGSINFDPRSFVLNAECSAACFSERIADEAAAAFRNDLRFARRVTIDDLNSISVRDKALDSLCYWLRAEL